MHNWQQVLSDEEYAKKLQQQLNDEEYAKKLQEELNKQGTGGGNNQVGNGGNYPGGGQTVPYQNSFLPGGCVVYPPSQPVVLREDFNSVCQRVVGMPYDRFAAQLASKYGFNISTVTYEDNARTKGTVWGPCISDMTLRVDNFNLPVIRSPNYEDLTWDVPIERIPIVVGNEHGENRRSITLKDYLQNFPNYLHAPYKWKSWNTSLLAPRDSAVIMSSQACFLPVPKDGGEAKFNVAIFNYQSTKSNPAVLAIVASEKGTSAQIVENIGGGQKLYFNDNGKACPFLGQRLSEYRIEKGETDLSKPMSQEEKQKNMLLIIQIPLKRKTVFTQPSNLYGYNGYYPTATPYSYNPFSSLSVPTTTSAQPSQYNAFNYESAAVPMSVPSSVSPFSATPGSAQPSNAFSIGSAAPAVPMIHQKSVQNFAPQRKADVENAIIKVGQSEGVFYEIGDLEIERDPQYPIRVTLQFYKATSNGVCDESHMSAISEQIRESRKFGVAIGSLVVGGNTGRVTEHAQPYIRPPWWNDFWLMYRNVYPQYTSESAAALVFKNGRFCNSSLSQCQHQIFDVLGTQSPGGNTPVTWNFM